MAVDSSFTGAELIYNKLSEVINPAGQSLAIKVTNRSGSYMLFNPQTYIFNGLCQTPPEPTVAPNSVEFCSFRNGPGADNRVTGLLTYEVTENQNDVCGILVIFFFVPFDNSAQSNWFALGVFPVDTPCNNDLYSQISSGQASDNHSVMKSPGSELRHEGPQVTVKGTISSVTHALMKVEIRDKI